MRAEHVAVAAVVVTYNRAELLRECLDGLAGQSHELHRVVVIDNNSTDGSGDVAREHPIGAQVHTLKENLGGAGGFATGMAVALKDPEVDWVWLMDDDTIPTPAALAELLKAGAAYPDKVDVLSSAAVWTDGRLHPMNISRERLGTTEAQRKAARELGARVIRTASFVSILLDAAACRRHGLPHADYFIWGDDTEYSGRLLKDSCGLQVRGSVVEHRTKAFGSWQLDPGERFFYEVRNKIWVFGRTRSFTPLERLLYGGSAALGWVRTVMRSKNKALLLGVGFRGLRAGLRRGPVPTSQVLSDLGPLSDDVRAIGGS